MRIPYSLQLIALGLNTAATTPALIFFGALKTPKHQNEPKPGHIDVHVGEPIPAEGLGKEAMPELLERTRDVIEGLVSGSG